MNVIEYKFIVGQWSQASLWHKGHRNVASTKNSEQIEPYSQKIHERELETFPIVVDASVHENVSKALNTTIAVYSWWLCPWRRADISNYGFVFNPFMIHGWDEIWEYLLTLNSNRIMVIR